MRNLAFISCALFVAVAALAEQQPYSRYQTIVDRQMFGPPPPDFDPTKMPSEVAKNKGSKADAELTKEQEQVKKAIKFSVLNVTPSGETVVGFSDNGDPKNPLHYYLKVGESQNGWTVKEADKDEATMTIVNKEGIEVTLRLGGDSASNAAAVSRVSAQQPNAGAGNGALLGDARSLRERRRLREEQIRTEEAAKHAADNAAREAAEKERAAREAAATQQREAEREEQRKQLLQIQEELRKAREAREAAKEKESGGENADSQAEN